MKKRTTITGLILGLALLLTTAGCNDGQQAKLLNDQIQKANAALVQAEQEGVPQWAPKKYSDAKNDYSQALVQVSNKKYAEAQTSVNTFYADLEEGRAQTRAAKAAADAKTLKEKADQQAKEQALNAQAEKDRQIAAAAALKKAEAEAKLDKAPADMKLVSYTVKKHDWLSKIAKKPEFYNDMKQWPRIYDANRTKIKNPNLIYPGQEVLVPKS